MGYYNGENERLRNEQPNLRNALELDDTVQVNLIGFYQNVRARYFLERMLETVEVNNGSLVFTFAAGNTQSISISPAEFT